MSKGSIFGKKTMPNIKSASKHEHGAGAFTDTRRGGSTKAQGIKSRMTAKKHTY